LRERGGIRLYTVAHDNILIVEEHSPLRGIDAVEFVAVAACGTAVVLAACLRLRSPQALFAGCVGGTADDSRGSRRLVDGGDSVLFKPELTALIRNNLAL
jgi:hypothetical protein